MSRYRLEGVWWTGRVISISKEEQGEWKCNIAGGQAGAVGLCYGGTGANNYHCHSSQGERFLRSGRCSWDGSILRPFRILTPFRDNYSLKTFIPFKPFSPLSDIMYPESLKSQGRTFTGSSFRTCTIWGRKLRKLSFRPCISWEQTLTKSLFIPCFPCIHYIISWGWTLAYISNPQNFPPFILT